MLIVYKADELIVDHDQISLAIVFEPHFVDHRLFGQYLVNDLLDERKFSNQAGADVFSFAFSDLNQVA